MCSSVANNARVARARAPLSSVQPPVWPPLLFFCSLSFLGACVPGIYTSHRERDSKLHLTSNLHKTSTPSPSLPAGGVAIRIKRPIHEDSISCLSLRVRFVNGYGRSAPRWLRSSNRGACQDSAGHGDYLRSGRAGRRGNKCRVARDYPRDQSIGHGSAIRLRASPITFARSRVHDGGEKGDERYLENLKPDQFLVLPSA